MSRPKAEKSVKLAKLDVQRGAILDAASKLFIDRGYGGTNFNDIADALGVSRTSLYYYFPSKESILAELTQGVTQQAREVGKAISSKDELPAPEALRTLIKSHASLILRSPLQFRVVERSEVDLPEPHRTNSQAARREILRNFVNVVERGVKQGHFRVEDIHVAAFSLIGMCNWCAWWFNPNGALSVETVAESLAELGLRAVLVPEWNSSRSAELAAEKLQSACLIIGQVQAQLSGKHQDRQTGPKTS